MTDDDQLKEIAPGVYEGVSPAKNEVRRFIALPENLTDDEELRVTVAALDMRPEAAFAINLKEKNESIGGRTFIRYLSDADPKELETRAKLAQNCLTELRLEGREGKLS
ncbi:hypothetical protein HOF40_01940 [Candidatus Parcubacteria bacterium]|jgi:hypothetical protein|nr:hypothetical protein [Candidatus Parcubacteria bacterium]MBT3948825.1 hypothetical protein [Candidatus Parcubacteria bacterium]